MLELKHVSKTFNPGTEDAKTALDDLSLSVADGDFITIIGANGAGKSTLFGAICGTFLTDSGSISSMVRTSPCSRSTAARASSGTCFRTPCAAARPA